MMAEMGMEVTAEAVANYYGDLLDGFVYDHQDAGQLQGIDGVANVHVDTIMNTAADRQRLAQDVMNFVTELI